MGLPSWTLSTRVFARFSPDQDWRFTTVLSRSLSLHAFFIRTSKLWPNLVVLKFWHNLSLSCS